MATVPPPTSTEQVVAAPKPAHQPVAAAAPVAAAPKPAAHPPPKPAPSAPAAAAGPAAAAVSAAAASLNYDNVGPAVKQFESVLVGKMRTPVYRFFAKMYAECREKAKEALAEYYGRRVNLANVEKQYQTVDLRLFQEDLREIQKWNTDRIAEAERQITAMAPGFQLQRLLKLIVSARSMVLASLVAKSKRVTVPVPTAAAYLHKVLFLVARELFDNAWLMKQCYERQSNSNRHLKAQLQVSRIVSDAIRTAVAELVPVDKIMENCLNDAADACDYQAVEAPAPVVANEEEEFGFSKTDDEGTDTDEGSEYEIEEEEEEEEEEENPEEEEEDTDDIPIEEETDPEEEEQKRPAPRQHQPPRGRGGRGRYFGAGRGHDRGEVREIVVQKHK